MTDFICDNSSHIKDSGDRREFETGAVRDMGDGKGRCDLLPLGSINFYFESDPILAKLNAAVKCRDVMKGYLVDAVNLFCKEAFNGDRLTMWLELAVHFEDGAKKYGDRNWEKGLPIESFLDSAIRHYLKWKRGDDDERHDRAFVWNCVCCLWTIDNFTKKESA